MVPCFTSFHLILFLVSLKLLYYFAYMELNKIEWFGFDWAQEYKQPFFFLYFLLDLFLLVAVAYLNLKTEKKLHIKDDIKESSINERQKEVEFVDTKMIKTGRLSMPNMSDKKDHLNENLLYLRRKSSGNILERNKIESYHHLETNKEENFKRTLKELSTSFKKVESCCLGNSSEVEDMKSTLLMLLSHELKTPLNGTNSKFKL